MKVDSSPLSFGASNAVQRKLSEQANQINLISEGRLVGTHNATTAAPTSGSHALGDYVRNSEPAELGTAGGLYVVMGWVCVLGGEPGTWVDCRVTTGN